MNRNRKEWKVRNERKKTTRTGIWRRSWLKTRTNEVNQKEKSPTFKPSKWTRMQIELDIVCLCLVSMPHTQKSKSGQDRWTNLSSIPTRSIVYCFFSLCDLFFAILCCTLLEIAFRFVWSKSDVCLLQICLSISSNNAFLHAFCRQFLINSFPKKKF